MKDYSNFYPSREEKQKYFANKMFERQYMYSGEGKYVYVDGDTYEAEKVIIQSHVNPLNEKIKEIDKNILFMSERIHLGSTIQVQGEEDDMYLVVNKPYYNGSYYSSKIRKLTNDISFSFSCSGNDVEEDEVIDDEILEEKTGEVIGENTDEGNSDNSNESPNDDTEKTPEEACQTYEYKCITRNGMFYNEQAFTNDGNVFEDADMMAFIIKYDEITSQLRLFHDVTIDGEHYRIVQIDNITLKEHKTEYGVLQIVAMKIIFGDIELESGRKIAGILKEARVKDKTLNAKSRVIYTNNNMIKCGDYVKYIYDRDKNGTKQTDIYIVRNQPVMRDKYDYALLMQCQLDIKVIHEGNIVTIPIFVDDNRVKINDKDTKYDKEITTYNQFIVQDNPITRRFGSEIKRIIINDKNYKIVGIAPIEEKGLNFIGIDDDSFNANTDNAELGIADYYNKNVYPYIDEGDEEGTPGETEIVGIDSIVIGMSSEYSLVNPPSGTILWTLLDSTGTVNMQISEDSLGVSIKIPSKLNLVGKTVTVRCQAGEIVVSKDIYIKGL